MASEYRKAQQLRLREKVQQQENLWQLNKAQYELARENIEVINRKCHDLRHQMDALRTVAGEEDREKELDAMRQAIRIYDTTFKTGNQSLDTVLMQKGLVCNQNSIALSVMADGKLLDFMNPVDLYTMMANLLDNAIEASLRIEDPQARSIHLSVHEKRGLVIIQEENPYEGTVTMNDGLPQTTKADQTNHGIGTRSIAATAEKYGGLLRMDPSDGMFVARVIFPSVSEKHVNQDEKMLS